MFVLEITAWVRYGSHATSSFCRQVSLLVTGQRETTGLRINLGILGKHALTGALVAGTAIYSILLPYKAVGHRLARQAERPRAKAPARCAVRMMSRIAVRSLPDPKACFGPLDHNITTFQLLSTFLMLMRTAPEISDILQLCHRYPHRLILPLGENKTPVSTQHADIVIQQGGKP